MNKKKFLSVLLSLAMVGSVLVLPDINATATSTADTAENCHELADDWFGENKNHEEYEFNDVLEVYFKEREYDFTKNSAETELSVSNEIQNDMEKRTALVNNMQELMNITFLDAEVIFNIDEVVYNDNDIELKISEWTFYDYDDLANDVMSSDTSGFGTKHSMTISTEANNFIILSDNYTEADMNGMTSSSYVEENNTSSHSISNKADNSDYGLSTMATYSYSPDAAVAYADTYWSNYNPNYTSYKGSGGDCANFVSQCMRAGGIPTDGTWYPNSSAWIGCTAQRKHFSSLGTLISNPSASQILKGNPVYYSSTSGSTWTHAGICVGTNSAGTPVVNAHTNDRYHVTWTLGYSTICTVQLSSNSIGSSLGSPVNVGDDFYAYIINTAAWKSIVNSDNGNVCLEGPEEVRKIWHFQRQSDGSYKITSAWDGKSLDVDNASNLSGANLKVYNYNGNWAQKWYIYGESAAFKLRAECTSCVIDLQDGSTSDGTNVQMWEYNNTAAQNFQIWKTDAPSEHIEGLDIGIIYNVDSGKVLTVNDKGYVQLGTENGYANQVWKFVWCSDGNYKIISALDGSRLDVETAGDENNLKLHTWPDDTNANNQRFCFYKQGNGFVIRPKSSSNRVLDCTEGGTADGTQIQIYDRNNTSAQIFGVYYANDVQLKAPTLSVSVNRENSTATFNWNEVYGEKRYDVKIWKNELWDGDSYHTEWGAKDGYNIELPAGTYQAYVDASNHFDIKMSNTVTFVIPERPTPTETPTPTPPTESTEEPDATESPTKQPATDGPKIDVSTATVSAAGTVDVIVSISENTGFSNLALEIGYDKDALTLESVKSNTDIPCIYTAAQNINTYPYNMGWDSTSNTTFNGMLATLTFSVNKSVKAGTYPVTVSYYKGVNGNYTDGVDVNYDENFNPLNLNYISGAVTISSHVPGDINGDGKVTNIDGTLLLRYLAGWDVDVDRSALDVNGDGKINNQDSTVLLRHLAGWDVEIH
ncbi:MAG: RICIN domain-containing protein [Oscillospiraceae bacterium]|nr:RICIN domain-containing protein [Oscillospiraceae bacterium]